MLEYRNGSYSLAWNMIKNVTYRNNLIATIGYNFKNI